MVSDIVGIIEVVLIAITAVITVFTAVYVGKQANRHFLLQRSTRFIERFNSGDMLRMRPKVDRLLASSPDWTTELGVMRQGGLDGERRGLFYDLVVFTNFFQELATAFEHGTIEEDYTWDVFGGLIRQYWTALRPYVLASREVSGRPTLYEGFERLAARMEEIDGKRRKG